MDLFAHRIHKAQLINGIVRLDFSVLKADSSGNFDPQAPVSDEDTTFTVNIPIGGFVRSMGVMRDMMQALHKDGVIEKMEREGAGGPGGRQGGPGPGGASGESPAERRKKMRDITKDDDSGEQLV